jgi:hypothetical protein
MSGESSGVACEFPAKPSNKTQDSNTQFFIVTTPHLGAQIFRAPNIRWRVTHDGTITVRAALKKKPNKNPVARDFDQITAAPWICIFPEYFQERCTRNDQGRAAGTKRASSNRNGASTMEHRERLSSSRLAAARNFRRRDFSRPLWRASTKAVARNSN